MRYTIEVINEPHNFFVRVMQRDIEIYRCGWHGGEFEDEGQRYAVLGPYHSEPGNKFRVYRLEPASEAV
jgi:hypothetical protein